MLDDARVRRPPVWRNSDDVCGFSDDERHLGHILKTGNHWTAFDSTRSNPEGTGFCLLGTFTSPEAAKKAVGQATVESRARSPIILAVAKAG